MIWFWAAAGALIGLILDSERALGFWLGMAVGVLFVKLRELGRRLEAAEAELETLRATRGRIALPPDAVLRDVERIGDEGLAPDGLAPDGRVPDERVPDELDRSAQPADAEAPTAAGAVPGAAPIPADTGAGVEPEPPPPPDDTPPWPSAAEPSAVDRGLMAVKRWFTEGNVPVKIGVLVLFAGVAAALRFAAAEGYLRLPIGLRLSMIAASALAALGFGWRERRRRPVFGLSLQGGAIGVLLLTIFASFRLFDLLPAGAAFALVVVLVAGAALLAVLQQALALAVLGFLGGYLAPVLLSTGSGNHVTLFSFYAVLNAAVLAISWRQQWRLLNLVGFVFTFGVGALWFSRSYRPELFWTVEPFLILFFLFYVLIGLLYVTRQTDRRQPWLDGTLVFGTPLVAFPMQAVLLRDQPMALAFSSLAVAGVYLALLVWLAGRRRERLLAEAYAGLALLFATLAVPLAFSAATTASLWALEGAAIAWLGLRQARTLPWLSGLALQPLAAVAYLVSEIDRTGVHELPLLNATWLGAALLGLAGLWLALLHDRHGPSLSQRRAGGENPLAAWTEFVLAPLPALLMIWGLGWWTCAGITQLEVAAGYFDGGEAVWRFAVLYLGFSLLAGGGLRRGLAWPRAGWGMALWAFLVLPCIAWANEEFPQVLAPGALPAWLAYLACLAVALWLNQDGPSRSLALCHGFGLWTVTLALTSHLGEWLDDTHAASGWIWLAVVAPTGLLSLGLWRRPRWLAWPRAEAFELGYRWLWFGLALPLLLLFLLFGLFDAGAAAPLPHVPLLNPLEIALAGVGLLLWAFCRDRLASIAAAWPLWSVLAFSLVSSATLRAVHHGHGERWSPDIFASGFAQASLTVVWSLLGVAAWVAGSRWRRRNLWLVGAGLMAVVLAKLLLVDRQFMGNIPGIVSFLAVGLLLVAVGYFAPSPPSHDASDAAGSSTPGTSKPPPSEEKESS